MAARAPFAAALIGMALALTGRVGDGDEQEQGGDFDASGAGATADRAVLRLHLAGSVATLKR